MDNDKLLLSQINDCIKSCNDNMMITNGNFLDIFEQSRVLSFYKNNSDVNFMFYGGYEDSERNIPVFLPYYIEIGNFKELQEYFLENTDLNPLCVIRAIKDNFSEIGHRDYLGALMGLGVKREMIGDILIHDKGADIIVNKIISKYLIENFNSAGRASLKCKTVGFDELIISQSEIKEETISVASPRLDNIISSSFNLSRNDSNEKIESGLVFVNGIQILKNDKKVNAGDKIVLRGKGKIVINESRGVSKKGRMYFSVNVYL